MARDATGIDGATAHLALKPGEELGDLLVVRLGALDRLNHRLNRSAHRRNALKRRHAHAHARACRTLTSDALGAALPPRTHSTYAAASFISSALHSRTPATQV